MNNVKAISLDTIEQIVKENLNPLLKTINLYLESSGFTYSDFNGFENNIEVLDINYILYLSIEKNVVLTKYLKCISNIFNVVEDDLKKKIILDFKKVSNFKVKKYVCAIGLTCDCVSLPIEELHERLSYLSKYLLEEEIWTLEDENVKKYYNIITNSDFDQSNTIVHSLICARLEGKNGKFIPRVLKSRISENKIELNDLIVTFVKYNYNDLIKDFAYLHKLKDDLFPKDIDKIITNFKLKCN